MTDQSVQGRDLKLLMLYFSGTGNTSYVAHYLARKLGHLPIEICLKSVERQPAQTAAGFDVLAFGFPIYACDSPSFLHGYLSRLVPGDGRGAFVFSTQGAFPGGAVTHNLRRLAERGYVPLGGGTIAMPGSDGLALVRKNSWFARSALNKDYDHLKSADRLATRMAETLMALCQGQPPEAHRQELSRGSVSRASDWVWAYLYDLVCDRFRTRFRADGRCAGCGLCARICPVNNVEMRSGRAHIGDLCGLCMRCLHNCPQEAIQIGTMTIDRFRWRGPKGQFRPLRLRPETAAETVVLASDWGQELSISQG
jgi:ferredoxin